jgi:hypothetical protein
MLGTFGIAHMHDVMARVKRITLAHIVLVGTPEGKVRPRRRTDEEGVAVYLAPLGLKTLHIGQTLVVT